MGRKGVARDTAPTDRLTRSARDRRGRARGIDDDSFSKHPGTSINGGSMVRSGAASRQPRRRRSPNWSASSAARRLPAQSRRQAKAGWPGWRPRFDRDGDGCENHAGKSASRSLPAGPPRQGVDLVRLLLRIGSRASPGRTKTHAVGESADVPIAVDEAQWLPRCNTSMQRLNRMGGHFAVPGRSIARPQTPRPLAKAPG